MKFKGRLKSELPRARALQCRAVGLVERRKFDYGLYANDIRNICVCWVTAATVSALCESMLFTTEGHHASWQACRTATVFLTSTTQQKKRQCIPSLDVGISGGIIISAKLTSSTTRLLRTCRSDRCSPCAFPSAGIICLTAKSGMASAPKKG